MSARHSGRLEVVKLDVDANPALAARYAAQSIPLLVALRDGREVDRIVVVATEATWPAGPLGRVRTG